MRNKAAVIGVLFLSALGCCRAAAGETESVFFRDNILRVMHRANDWQKAHPRQKETDRNWIRGTWYTGVMNAYKTTGDGRFLTQARDWGQQHQWQVGTERAGANRLFCVQTWLELYLVKNDKALIGPAVQWLDTPQDNSPAGAKRWYLAADRSYADSLYGAAALAMLAKATGDKKYLDTMHAFFWDVADELWDKDAQLIYRDNLYIGKKTANGQKILWSRGNGWVAAGLARILEYLPEDDPQRPRYVEMLQEMAAALAKRQDADGLWRPNLDDPAEFPMQETSGSGFFCYALAWGINHKLLDPPKYLPVVRKAWAGLVACLSPEGMVQWGQQVGAKPFAVEQDQTHEYVTGTFLLAASEVYRLADAFVTRPVLPAGPPVPMLQQPIQLSEKFPRLKAPGTGRGVVQLTSGSANCYPLYYFIPSINKEGKYLVYHRYEQGHVQLWRLNLQTAEARQLTHADAQEADWRPWQVEPGLRGVYDYRSVLNVARNQVIYLDGRQAHVVDLETLQDQVLFDLPADRELQGQNCVTPDGRWFVYIHRPPGSSYKKPCQGSAVVACNLDTREQKTLCTIDNAIHHVTAYDNDHLFVHHPPGYNGMCFVDFTSGKWTDLRWGDPGVRGHSCHSVATSRGFAYEAGRISGLYEPLTRRRFEFALPSDFGSTHTGWDPEGRLWFWETAGKTSGHSLWYLEKLDAAGGAFQPLSGDWPTYVKGQRGHFHPQLTPDRRWILFTAGDPQTNTAQTFLLDVSDLKDTQGIDTDMLRWGE